MPKYLPLLLLLALYVAPASAQKDFSFPEVNDQIYPASAGLIDRLITGRLSIDSLPNLGRGLKTDSLPGGHYLKISLREEVATVSYFNTYQHRVEARRQAGKLSVRVYDTEGISRQDATVTADERPLRYNSRSKSYTRREWRVDQLTVVIGTDTLFYSIEESNRRTRIGHTWHTLKYREPIHSISYPYYLGRSLYHSFKAGISWGVWNFRGTPYPFSRLINKLLTRRPLVGYTTTSQPKYQPGDTLDLTVYLAKFGGRPLRDDSVVVRISENQTLGQKLIQAAPRVGVGTYRLRYPIPSDWKQGKMYHVSFCRNRSGYREVDTDISFKYEDYELDEYRVEMELTQDARSAGSAWVDIITEDINGLPLPEGELNIYLLPQCFVAHASNREVVALPDTLFHYREATDGRRATRVIVPDSLFPKGHSLIYHVVATISGPSGEMQSTDGEMLVDRRYRHWPDITTVGDSLLLSVQQYELGATGKTLPATLTRVTESGDTTRETTTVPRQIKIDHALRQLELTLTDQTTSINQPYLAPEIDLDWQRDTLMVTATNEYNQRFYWSLYAGPRAIITDRTDTDYRHHGFDPEQRITLNYRYFARGRWHYHNETTTAPRYHRITEHENILDIELDQPNRAVPGETVDVQILARDGGGRPAGGVNLSAGVLNARFADLPVDQPTYVRKQKVKRDVQAFTISPVGLPTTATTARPWLLKSLRLDTSLAYQLLYPDSTFIHYRDIDTIMPDKQRGAHIAPFVVKHHRSIPIRTVYVDDRLVYIHGPRAGTPYSIPTDSGWHKLSLRTDEYEYTRRLYLPSRRQTVVSFIANNYAGAGWDRTTKKQWSTAELRNVEKHAFITLKQFDHWPISIRARNGIIQTAEPSPSKSETFVGTLRTGDHLSYWQYRPEGIILDFEPGAMYHVTTDRDRLYPIDTSYLRRLLTQPTRFPKAPGLPRYRWKKEYLGLPHLAHGGKPSVVHRYAALNGAHSGRIQIIGVPSFVERVLIRRDADDNFHQFDNTTPFRLGTGRHELIYDVGDRLALRQIIHVPLDSIYLISFAPGDTIPFTRTAQRSTWIREKPSVPTTTELIEYIWGADRITGRVIDITDDMPLVGASILIQGTTRGTVSDIDGNFSLNVPNDAYTLIISYTGFSSERMVIDPGRPVQSTTVIALGPSYELLDEVVVTGYSVQHKRALTGSVSTVLAGKVAGLHIEERTNPREASIDFLPIQNLPPPEIRESFNDLAAYVPHLQTDSKGRAHFRFTYPDDITAWNTFVVGQDRRRRIGFDVLRSRSYLPLQAQLYLPRFLVEGDQSEARTLAVNRTDKSLPVRLLFTGGGADAGAKNILLKQSLENSYPIAAPDLLPVVRRLEDPASGRIPELPRLDSVSYQFSVRADTGDGDGEKRSVPIYPKGTEMVVGGLFVLDDNHERGLPTRFADPTRGPVTLRLVGNRVDQLLGDLDYITDYPYGCAEQLASKLIGLLAKRRIQLAEGKTPGLDRPIKKLIAGFEKLRKPDGGYGWWGGSEASSVWISLHVYRALSAAATAGDYVTSDLTSLHRYLLTNAGTRPPGLHMSVLWELAENGNLPTDAELLSLDTLQFVDIYPAMIRARLHQLRNDTIDVETLLKASKRHAAGGRYWLGAGYVRGLPLRNQLGVNLLAHRILRDAGRYGAAGQVMNYLLGQSASDRRPGNLPLLGTNTLESALLIQHLLPDVLADDETLRPPSVLIRRPGGEQRVTTFPYETLISPRDLPRVQLQKEGAGPVPTAVFQRFFDRSPEADGNGFTVSSQFINARGRPIASLTKGTEATLEVTLKVAADTDYVLIEVPIPAGCSYGDRDEPRGSYAVHRAYERDRVAIFCERLPSGTYTYRVSLEPRFSGEYTLNPVRVEAQYLPTVNGNGVLKTVRVQ